MSSQNKGVLIQAVLGAVLITILMLPFQGATPFAPYSAMLILPVMLFFTLSAPPKALLGMFLSFACGVGWAGAFILVKDALPGMPLEVVMGVGIAAVIFGILSIHPIVLGRTPFGIVPAVLLGLIESLLVTMVMPLLRDGEPRLNLLWLLVIFGYGCVMTLILVLVQDKLISSVLGKEWRSAPTLEEPSSQFLPTPHTRTTPPQE